MNMAWVRNEEKHVQPTKGQLKFLWCGLVGGFAHRHTRVLVFLFDFLRVSTNERDSIFGD